MSINRKALIKISEDGKTDDSHLDIKTEKAVRVVALQYDENCQL